MIYSKALLQTAFIAAIGLLPVACAKPADQSGMQGMSGMQRHSMQGTDMQGMDMQTTMNQCADMRRQMTQGTHPNTPDMAKMTAQCDEMDRSMSTMPGMNSAAPAMAPAATRSR